MKITRHEIDNVTTNTFRIEDPIHGMLVYKEYVNSKGKVIDYNLRKQSGEEITDPAILEVVQAAVDSYLKE